MTRWILLGRRCPWWVQSRGNQTWLRIRTEWRICGCQTPRSCQPMGSGGPFEGCSDRRLSSGGIEEAWWACTFCSIERWCSLWSTKFWWLVRSIARPTQSSSFLFRCRSEAQCHSKGSLKISLLNFSSSFHRCLRSESISRLSVLHLLFVEISSSIRFLAFGSEPLDSESTHHLPKAQWMMKIRDFDGYFQCRWALKYLAWSSIFHWGQPTPLSWWCWFQYGLDRSRSLLTFFLVSFSLWIQDRLSRFKRARKKCTRGRAKTQSRGGQPSQSFPCEHWLSVAA